MEYVLNISDEIEQINKIGEPGGLIKKDIETAFELEACKYLNQKGFYYINLALAREKAKQMRIKDVPFYLSDKNFHCKQPFEDKSMEDNDSNDAAVHSGHRMFDLHGFTSLGAEQALRRIFCTVDRSRQQVIKINVGIGSHSKGGVAKLPDVVKKVANDLQLPAPVQHDKNPGYLLMILPPIANTE